VETLSYLAFETMTNAVVKEKIAAWLEGGLSQRTNLNVAAWRRKQPVPFGDFSLQRLTELVRQALADMDFFEPKVSVRIMPDPARKVADLQVEIADEGIKGTIDEIEVSGLRANSRQQILDFLALKPGMELHGTLVNTVSNQLWRSGRFFHHAVNLSPLPQTAKFNLELDLEELREAPPLNQEFAPEVAALLKFRDWILDWQKRPEDLISSGTFSNDWIHVESDLVLSASGLAAVARWSDSTGSPPRLNYAFVAGNEHLGFYSAWRGRKLALKPTRGEVLVFMRWALDPKPQSGQHFELSMGAVVSCLGRGQPFLLELDLPPVAMVRAAHEAGTNLSLSNGVLSIVMTDPQEKITQDLKVDAATGRLINHTISSEQWKGRAHPEAGAFARLVREIATATINHTNEYVANRGFSSWLSFLITDLVESPLLTEPSILRFLEQTLPEDQRGDVLERFDRIKPLLNLAVGAPKQNLASIFEPLNQLTGPKPAEDDEDQFLVLVRR
jgi:hypothetical protein